jgi:hypothetical protein
MPDTTLTRKVIHGAVRFNNSTFTHPALLELEGRTVALVQIPDDARTLGLLVDGRHVGDAYEVSCAPAVIPRALRHEEREHGSLTGARLVETENYLACFTAVNDAAADLEIAAVFGEAGLGKTLATSRASIQAAEAHSLRRVFVRLKSATSGPALLAAVLEQLYGVAFVRPSQVKYYEDSLFAALCAPTLFHIDEAQYLTDHALHEIRALHDSALTRLSVLLTGGNGCWNRISSDPMLRDRVPIRVPFRRFTEPEVPTVMRAFHEVFENGSDETLRAFDQAYARGVFRPWRHIARTLQRMGATAGDADIFPQVLIRLGVRDA